MPFKTKKRKASANTRHVINFSNSATLNYLSAKQNIGTDIKNNEKITLKSVQTIENDYSFVKSEIVKIILLASMIIGFQIALKISHFSIFR